MTPVRIERVVRDARFERLVAAASDLVRLADGAIWAEGPGPVGGHAVGGPAPGAAWVR